MPRPAAVVLGWVAATAAAVAVAYAGVSSVAGGVVEPLPATVGQPSPSVLAEALASESASADATPGTPSPADTTTPDDAGGTPDTAPATTPPPSTAPSTAPSATPSATPRPTSAPASELRSYSLVGGSATLRYEPGRVTVVSAEPAQGFSYAIEGNGTAEVRVDFRSEEHRSRLKGTWEDGGPREEIEESGEVGDDHEADDD